MKVGWVGLGEIGQHMAQRVIAAGHDLVAYDRGAGKGEVQAAGGALSADYRSIAAECDVLGTCLFDDAQVRQVMFEEGMLEAMRPGSVLASHTTGSPVLARELAERAPPGVTVLDACFSGGPAETQNGELTLMVGGEAEALETARPVLSTYASKIHLLGPVGSGQTIKLLNNLLFSVQLKQAADIVAVAEEMGLDPALSVKVIQQSSGASMAMGLFQSGHTEATLKAASRYMVKDVAMVEAAAAETGIDLSLFDRPLDYYRR